jgi:hypothetical protein
LPKENVFKVSKDYCNCLEKQLSGAKDSTVNLNDCERLIFSKSRLLSIYSDYDNWDSYEKKTLDSAKKFAIEVRNITDTLCYNKIDFKKVKKIRQM